jgi:hypothetical protein
MIPGSQPMQVTNDKREQTSEAMARPDVCCAGGFLGNPGARSGGTEALAVASGTMTLAWQTGQAISVPT